jgi:hypothetical protein
MAPVHQFCGFSLWQAVRFISGCLALSDVVRKRLEGLVVVNPNGFTICGDGLGFAYNERGTPMHRRILIDLKRKKQRGKCALRPDDLPSIPRNQQYSA